MRTSQSLPASIIISIFLIFSTYAEADAQWVRTSGPIGGYVTCLLPSGDGLYAGTTSDYGIFHSSNNGGKWLSINEGLPNPIYAYAMAEEANNLYLGTYNGGVYRSTDKGANWVEANEGLADTRAMGLLSTQNSTGGSLLFAATEVGGIFRSTDSGRTWHERNAGFTSTGAWPLVQIGEAGKSLIFVGTKEGGVFRSSDFGESWSETPTGIASDIYAMTATEEIIYAGSKGEGIVRSTDRGVSWSSINEGLSSLQISSLLADGLRVFAGSLNGRLFFSDDRGDTWSDVTGAISAPGIFSAVVKGSILYVGTAGGVWKRPVEEFGSLAVRASTKNDAFELSPNPTNDMLTVTSITSSSSKVQVSIVGLLGQQVMPMKVHETGTFTLDLSTLSNGIYILRCVSPDTSTSQMFVKQ